MLFSSLSDSHVGAAVCRKYDKNTVTCDGAHLQINTSKVCCLQARKMLMFAITQTPKAHFSCPLKCPATYLGHQLSLQEAACPTVLQTTLCYIHQFQVDGSHTLQHFIWHQLHTQVSLILTQRSLSFESFFWFNYDRKIYSIDCILKFRHLAHIQTSISVCTKVQTENQPQLKIIVDDSR